MQCRRQQSRSCERIWMVLPKHRRPHFNQLTRADLHAVKVAAKNHKGLMVQAKAYTVPGARLRKSLNLGRLPKQAEETKSVIGNPKFVCSGQRNNNIHLLIWEASAVQPTTGMPVVLKNPMAESHILMQLASHALTNTACVPADVEQRDKRRERGQRVVCSGPKHGPAAGKRSAAVGFGLGQFAARVQQCRQACKYEGACVIVHV